MEEIKMKTEKKAEEPKREIDINALISQNRALYERLVEAQKVLAYKRLDYLFKVMEYRGAFDSDFLGDCIKEIQDTIMPPEPEKENEEEKQAE